MPTFLDISLYRLCINCREIFNLNEDYTNKTCIKGC